MNQEREIAFVQPTGVAPKRKKVSADKLDRAAAELGMLTMNARKIRNLAVVGEFLDQNGIIRVANGKWMASAECVSRAIAQCMEIASNRELDLDTRGVFLRLQLQFVKVLDDNTAKMIDANFGEAAASAISAPVVRPFQIGQPIQPIQININANEVSKIEKSG